MKKTLALVSVLLLISCKENTSEPVITGTSEKTSFSESLEVTSNRRVDLLPKARKEVNEWLAYATAQNEMETLRNSTGHDILEASNSIMQIMESLKSSVPDTLQTPAIMARANVLETKAKILYQLSNKKEKNAKEIFEIANDLIEEFDNFKLQLNELFLKSPIDFEKELDEEFMKQARRDTNKPRTTEPLPRKRREMLQFK